jgi:TorA maturation chaperone TorD
MDKTMNDHDLTFSGFTRIRAESYVLLASLVGQRPTAGLKNILQDLEWDDAVLQRLASSLSALRAAGREYPVETMQTEFDKLFVGLGSAELLPYASWYLEKRIQSRPLANLRADLYRLGIVRKDSDHEPEDRATALCEVMAIISAPEDPYPLATQSDFFGRHLAGWMGLFFQDLTGVRGAAFYRTVGRFGLYFMEDESQYLGCHLNSIPVTKRRTKYENGTYRKPAHLS